MKRDGDRIVVLTAHDAMFARMLDQAGVDMLLVGDSLAQVVLGYETTLPVTLGEMIHHAAAVRRGAPDAFVVLDLPFMSYQVSAESALESAGRAMKEAHVQGVKLEGGSPRECAAVELLVSAGIPVMGHLGLTPQSVHAIGGYRVQGRGEDAAARLRNEALALQDAGCFSIVLELIPAALATEISESLSIPTIGIGAGVGCDGQVLVTPDLLGLNPGFQPKFLKRYADLDGDVRTAVEAFVSEVREGLYPTDEHSFSAE